MMIMMIFSASFEEITSQKRNLFGLHPFVRMPRAKLQPNATRVVSIDFTTLEGAKNAAILCDRQDTCG